MLKVFLDANVILEVMLRRTHHADAAAVLKAGAQHHIDLFTSSSVVGFVAYWMIKDLGLQETKNLLKQLFDFVRVIDIKHEQLLYSLQAEFKDLEDGIQYYTAIQHELDYFATFNKNDFRRAMRSVKVLSPAELMKIIF